ncbi:hypothetical protein JNO42_08880 [Pseudomonas putida]|uniref:hypothetical protein n=1 Tax=Pseudomonas putida TaxID=303 RepID=UPI001EF7DFC3|nr:hypothetical protein [Pseudomonas putida]ULL07112.1 hypothetical protein JNO42_08880 [Pseudomonas putida]
MSRIQRIIFNETSLEHALSAVCGLHNMSTDLIAGDVFRQLSELATYQLTPVTVWCGQSGLYQSKMEAVGNGEQRIESAILIGEPNLAGLAVDSVEVTRLAEENLQHRNLQIEADDLIKSLRTQLAERDGLLRDCFTAMLKGGYSKPLRERIKTSLSGEAHHD